MSRDGAHLAFADKARALAQGDARALRLLIPEGSRANIDVITTLFTDLTGVTFEIGEASVREIGTTLLMARLQDWNAFDIALPPTYEIPDLVAAQALLPLDDIVPTVAGGAGVPRGQYINGDSFDGHSFGFQTDGDVLLMFLNRTLLDDRTLTDSYADRFGEAFGPPTSWEEFDRQVRFVHETKNLPGAVLFRAYGQIEWEFWLRLHAKGYWPLSSEFEPQFDTDIGRQVLEEMIAITPFIETGSSIDQNFVAGWRRFADTGAYATFGWGGTQKLFRRPEFDIAGSLTSAPVPGGAGPETPDSLPYFNWGWSYTVARDSPVPELALAFILFAISGDVSTRAVREINGFFDPFRPEHYRDEAIRQIYGDAFLAEHQASMDAAVPDFYIANRGAYFEVLGSWLKLALDGVVSPKDALKNTSDHWRLLTASSGQEKQARRWRQLRAKYPHEIATRLRDIPL